METQPLNNLINVIKIKGSSFYMHVLAGQSPGIGNTFPMPPLNPQMVRNGNGGQVAMNEIKVDRNEKIIDPTAQAAGNGRRRGY